MTLSLVRAWASTEAALRSALRRRIARADSLGDALASGRHPSRAELRAWVVGDDATQLAFPELVSDPVSADVRALLESVRAHAAGARRTLAVVGANAGAADDRRCSAVREIRRNHDRERIIVFSQFADSVREMFARLRGDGRVAAVTANGALVAGGPLTRTQALSRFAPLASSSSRPSHAEAIEVLIATDLLSEGLNLQDASVVVHLDLPWTAARLTQRLGRIWRIGSEHARVHEYALAPPAPADELLRITEVLTRKAGAAWSAIGEPFSALLASRAEPVPSASRLDRVRAGEEMQQLLRRWSCSTPDATASVPTAAIDPLGEPPVLVAGVRAASDGWIAAVSVGGDIRVVGGRTGSQASTDPHHVLEIARGADGGACVTSPSRVARVIKEVDAYLEAERAAADAGVGGMGSRARVAAASRIAALAATAPPHRRPAVSRLAADARRTVAASRSAGAERLLAALVSDASGDDSADAAENWLERVVEASEPSVPNGVAPSGRYSRLHALIVLVPGGNRE